MIFGAFDKQFADADALTAAPFLFALTTWAVCVILVADMPLY